MNDDALCNWMMNSQADHTRSQSITVSRWLDQIPEKESPAPTTARTTKTSRETFWTRRWFGLKYGIQSLIPIMGRMTNHKQILIVFLPKEFMAPVDSDVSFEELGVAQLTLKPTH
jgi:hypothetical protein